jgi:hypothetical protein
MLKQFQSGTKVLNDAIQNGLKRAIVQPTGGFDERRLVDSSQDAWANTAMNRETAGFKIARGKRYRRWVSIRAARDLIERPISARGAGQA